MRSATPQLSRKVAEETVLFLLKSRAKEIISMSPSRITAALVLSPQPRPSQKPAPTATMFCGKKLWSRRETVRKANMHNKKSWRARRPAYIRGRTSLASTSVRQNPCHISDEFSIEAPFVSCSNESTCHSQADIV